MSSIKNNQQINLKLPSNLKYVAEEYAEYHGYTNVQELIRESLRDKVFREEVREEYIEKLLLKEKNAEWLGSEKSKEALLKLGKIALEYKNKDE